ncbi:unnamed protein product [Prorocentrum cordatum]|uniref:Serine/threonine-protein phosphatase 2A activator n=1 Tax=Prorocentrum cordatum TaxID=2364126 RepID=A0ABN9TQ43_9DINO|nr:unnamed protein product [Polarella glacialis]
MRAPWAAGPPPAAEAAQAPTRAPWAAAAAAAERSPAAGTEGASAACAEGGGSAASAPRKRIHSQQDFDVFQRSRLCEQLVSFAQELSEAVKGLPRGPERAAGAAPLACGLRQLLGELEGWIGDFPPLAQPMRFGNKAFRQWHARLVERGAGLLAEALGRAALPRERADALGEELSHYRASRSVLGSNVFFARPPRPAPPRRVPSHGYAGSAQGGGRTGGRNVAGRGLWDPGLRSGSCRILRTSATRRGG